MARFSSRVRREGERKEKKKERKKQKWMGVWAPSVLSGK